MLFYFTLYFVRVELIVIFEIIKPLKITLKLIKIILPMVFFIGFLQAQSPPKSIDERRAWAKKVYKEAIVESDSLKLAEAYYLFGKIEDFTTGNYLRTKAWYYKSLWILEKRPPSYELARLHLRLGNIERKMGNYESSLVLYRKGLYLAEASDNDNAKVNALSHLGIFYSAYGEVTSDNENPNINLDSASYYYNEAEKLAFKIGNEEGLLEIRTAKENLKRLKGEGIDYFQMSALAASAEGQKNVLEIRTLLRMAESYMDKRDFKEGLKSLEKAKYIFEHFIPHEQETGTLIETSFVDFYVRQENWRMAYLFLKRINDKEKRRRLLNNEQTDLELKEFYEVQQKEIIIQNQEEELKLFKENINLQRRSLWLMFLLLGITGLSAGLFYYLYRKNREIRFQNELLVKEQSHRFRNNLQVVSDLLALQSYRINAESARKAMEESQLRLNSIAALHKRLYRKDVLNTIQLDSYLKEIIQGVLVMYSLEKSVTVEYSLKAINVSPDEAISLGLIFTELMTNSCKYAFKSNYRPALQIFMNQKADEVKLFFKDNGKNPFGEALKEKSFGMKIIDLQVKQVKGIYKFYKSGGQVFEMTYKRKTSSSVLNGSNENT